MTTGSQTSLDNTRHARTYLDRARSDYHHAIILAHLDGHSVRTIAAVAGVSHQTVHNIITRHRAGNS